MATIVNNKKGRFDYIIIDEYEAGISLKGWEIKALRANQGNIKESYATIKKGEVLLIGAHFSPLANSNSSIYFVPSVKSSIWMFVRSE